MLRPREKGCPFNDTANVVGGSLSFFRPPGVGLVRTCARCVHLQTVSAPILLPSASRLFSSVGVVWPPPALVSLSRVRVFFFYKLRIFLASGSPTIIPRFCQLAHVGRAAILHHWMLRASDSGRAGTSSAFVSVDRSSPPSLEQQYLAASLPIRRHIESAEPIPQSQQLRLDSAKTTWCSSRHEKRPMSMRSHCRLPTSTREMCLCSTARVPISLLSFSS